MKLKLRLTCLLAAAGMAQAQTPTESVIYSFSTFPYGANPYAPLVRDAAGNLYGTTNQGGQADVGLVFRLSPSGKETILHNFMGGSDGANPYSGVLLAGGGNLYGTTYQGGASNAGVVYEISASGKETVLYSFSGGVDGGNPYSGVIADSAGNLYGTTYNGGAFGYGTVYKLAPTGEETVLHSFTDGADGGNPYAGVIRDSSGNLYGTAVNGGSAPFYPGGVVYKLSPAGQQTVLYSFNADNFGPGQPYAGVILDSAGNRYGAAAGGGEHDGGIVYEISATGAFSVLHSFDINRGPAMPKGGLARDSSGNLYGTTEECNLTGLGAVYKLEPGGQIQVLHTFAGSGDDTYKGDMNAGVILDSEGNLYGTTPYGGMQGMVYKLSPDGTETTLYNFTPAPGGTNPSTGVTAGSSGDLYGATQFGGASDWGVVYRLGSAGRESALYSFTGGADGGAPRAGVVLDSAGNVYGTTYEGGLASGAAGFGVVYKISTTGQETVLHTFTGGADGGNPGQLIIDSSGDLYGVAGYGVLADGTTAAGVVFKIPQSGVGTVLYTFAGGTDGSGPNGVTLGPAGNLYGTTYAGGAAGYGVVFRLSALGEETVLYDFPGGPEGALPGAAPYRDSAGNLYGTTSTGGGSVGEAGAGVVFELTAAGTYAVLYRFTGGGDGGSPFSGVVRDAAGNLCGTTLSGGTTDCNGGCGVAYSVSPSGRETVLHAFAGGADGWSPYAGLYAGPAGTLYGTTAMGGTSGGGVVFRISQ
jgi:uncharacterized repeat protein (TIGR03803 family)